MRKVLIISYFFPPCNLTAAQRVGSWHKYLPENGFYPIVITRKWTGKELTAIQRQATTDKETKVIKDEKSEIHYLEYKSSLRDRIFIKSQNNFLYKKISQLLTAITLVLQNIFLSSIPYNNFYYYSKNILKKNPDIKLLIISANPFEQFFFGYLLKKEFAYIEWIADYRDDWNTTEVNKSRTFFSFFSTKAEKKWISTASLITSVSPYYVDKITRFVNKKGATIFNGFDETFLTPTKKLKSNQFIITYNGTLYSTQYIEIFLEGFKLFVNSNKNISIHMHFPGLGYNPEQEQRVKNILTGYEANFSTYNRLPQKDVVQMQEQSECLLMVSHHNIKGIPSSKIFEYIGLGKNFIVCPGDNDILNEIAYNSKLGVVLNSKEEVLNYLNDLLNSKLSNMQHNEIDMLARQKYSVKNQVKELSNILKSL